MAGRRDAGGGGLAGRRRSRTPSEGGERRRRWGGEEAKKSAAASSRPARPRPASLCLRRIWPAPPFSPAGKLEAGEPRGRSRPALLRGVRRGRRRGLALLRRRGRPSHGRRPARVSWPRSSRGGLRGGPAWTPTRRWRGLEERRWEASAAEEAMRLRMPLQPLETKKYPILTTVDARQIVFASPICLSTVEVSMSNRDAFARPCFFAGRLFCAHAVRDHR